MGRDGIGLGAELGSGTHRSAELQQHQARAQFAESEPVAGERRPPGLDLIGHREGQRLLHAGLGHQGDGTVAGRKGAERSVERGDAGIEEVEQRSEAEDEARVDDVLARGAAMQALGIGLAYSGAELANEIRHDDSIARETGR